MSYDSIFTNKLFTSDTNKKFWLTFKTAKNLPFLDNQNGSFFVVKKFNENDSKILNSNKSLRFDNNGNISVKDNDTGLTLLKFKNPLTKFDFDITEPAIVDLKNTPRQNFILSNNLKWILVNENNIYYLLYNPIHRKSFATFYGKQDIGSSDGLTPKLKNLIYKYCEITAEPNTEAGKRRFADQTCSCAILDECIDKAIGVHIDNDRVRNSVGQKCVCTPSCEITGIDSDSWMSKANPQSFPKKVISMLGECPSIKNIICNQEIKAYNGDVQMENVQLSALCGFEETKPPIEPPIKPIEPPIDPLQPEEPKQQQFTTFSLNFIIIIALIVFFIFLIFL
jgi:hypothetical protein